MRSSSSALRARFAREDLTLCKLFSLKTPTGKEFFFTDLTSNVEFGGDIYRADPGCAVSAIRRNVDTGQSNATVDIGLIDEYLTAEMIRYGDIDRASFKLSVIDYKAPEAGEQIEFEGIVLNVNSSDKERVSLDVGSFQGFAVMLGEQYSQRCRNVFGDRRCKVDVDALAIEFSVTSVEANGVQFYTTAALPGDVDPPDISETTELVFGPGVHTVDVPPYQVLAVEAVSSGGQGGAAAVSASVDGLDGEEGDAIVFADVWAIRGGYGGLGSKRTTVRPPAADDPAGVAGFWRGYLAAADRPGSWLYVPVYTDRNWRLEVPYPGPQLYEEGRPPEYSFLPEWQYTKGEFFAYQGAAGTPGAPHNAAVVGRGDTSGGNGGRGHLFRCSYTYGEPDAPEIGAQFEIRVGAPGNGAAPGYVKVTFSFNQEIPATEFDLGSILWLSGQNTGETSQIASNTNGQVSLASPTPFPVKPGDRARFRPGCSNMADMCLLRYDNLKNMRAEPVVPTGTSTGAPAPVTKTVPDPQKPASSGSGWGFSTPGDAPPGA